MWSYSDKRERERIASDMKEIPPLVIPPLVIPLVLPLVVLVLILIGPTSYWYLNRYCYWYQQLFW